MKKIFGILLVAVLALGALDADAARRLGGGGSLGRQSSNVTQRQAQPAPAAPTQAAPSNGMQQPGAAPSAAQTLPQRRPWGGILGGIAAGLGLAWLANTLGLGPAFGQFLVFALIALVLFVVFGMMLRRRTPQAQGPGWQGSTVDNPLQPRVYNPEKVGNDASARPWEHAGSGIRIGSGLEPMPPAGLSGSQNWGVPAGFDADGFLTAAKRNFVTLQDAWDRGDLKSLRSMMTDGMLREISAQLGERERQPAGPQKTEVVMLEAQLLGIEEMAGEWMASVEFSGMIREDVSAGPSPFREVWNMTKPKDGSQGWLVAGVQALQ
ncbi:Tim44 domain-containing protein [Ramlibacter sp. G-1-2-2]|uniref:Tim44 domain-containing protein n=1 Tax=Ramlibacter agri TaxID=2728837 RepID=A0A848H016_9BURK|nr:TIM44-like domain-containing protein [Ramlibacter agri]NML43787.1 Tim44 domain-containing protein [Ramlibacter agri]